MFNLELVNLLAALGDSFQSTWNNVVDSVVGKLFQLSETPYLLTRLFEQTRIVSSRIAILRRKLALKLLGATNCASALKSIQDQWSTDYNHMRILISYAQVLLGSELIADRPIAKLWKSTFEIWHGKIDDGMAISIERTLLKDALLRMSGQITIMLKR